jgi:2-hydroxy-3-keto-5-methylthiopentenyl-1-phosphate phosphatase
MSLNRKTKPFWKNTDISAAKHADLLFVKTEADGENDLAVYCKREKIKHIVFDEFSKVLPVVDSIVKGTKTIQELVQRSLEDDI